MSMDGDYKKSLTCEKIGNANFENLLKIYNIDYIFLTNKSDQYEFGDYKFWHKSYPNKVYYGDIKNEYKYTGNLFLETDSNKSKNVPGWMDYCKLQSCDFLIYQFLGKEIDKSSKFYIPQHHPCSLSESIIFISLNKLRKFFFEVIDINTGKRQCDLYRNMPQSKYEQNNNTYGSLVPLFDILKNMRCQAYSNVTFMPIDINDILVKNNIIKNIKNNKIEKERMINKEEREEWLNPL